MKEKFINLFIKNWHWKILALVAACLFWYAYMNIQDPVTSENINGVKVKVLNYDEFMAKGNNVEFEDKSLDFNNLTLNVTVRGRSSLLTKLVEQKDRAFNVWIDLYELSADDDRLSIHYEFAQAYRAAYNNVQFVSLYNQSYYTVNVDEDVSKTVPLEYQIVGSPAEGYTYIENDPNTMLTPTEITVTGSQSDIEEVESAQIMVSVEGLKANVALSEPIMYYDADGSRIYLSSTVSTSTDAATLYIPIYQVKTIPFEVRLTGEAQEGYHYQNDASLSIDSVVVYGQESDLKEIEKISLPIDLGLYTGAATEVFNVDDVLTSLYPNGEVQYYSGSKSVRVSFTVAEILEQEITVPNTQIVVHGLPEGWSLNFVDDGLTFAVRGTQNQLSALADQVGLIKVTVSAAGPKAGRQELTATIALPKGPGAVLVNDSVPITVELEEPVVAKESEDSKTEKEKE